MPNKTKTFEEKFDRWFIKKWGYEFGGIRRTIKADFFRQQIKEVIDEIIKKKFPIGKRKWCIECAEEITKKLEKKFL